MFCAKAHGGGSNGDTGKGCVLRTFLTAQPGARTAHLSKQRGELRQPWRASVQTPSVLCDLTLNSKGLKTNAPWLHATRRWAGLSRQLSTGRDAPALLVSIRSSGGSLQGCKVAAAAPAPPHKAALEHGSWGWGALPFRRRSMPPPEVPNWLLLTVHWLKLCHKLILKSVIKAVERNRDWFRPITIYLLRLMTIWYVNKIRILLAKKPEGQWLVVKQV